MYNRLKNAVFSAYHQVLAPLYSPKIKVLNRHHSYDEYVQKQKEKTLDPSRIEKWMGSEWGVKLDGFRELFKRNSDFVSPGARAICLGARTGQEVVALEELGVKAIGVDLVAFPPHTVEGDIHNLAFSDGEFDLAFTNIFDHSAYPEKFASEMERVCTRGAYMIINLQVATPGDDYSENIIYDGNEVAKLFKRSQVLHSRRISNTFDGMNWELVLQKN